MKEYRPARKRVTVSVGESVRILRELQELEPESARPAVRVFRRPPFRLLRMTEFVWVSSGQRFWPGHSSVIPGCWYPPGWQLSDKAAA